LVENSIGSSKKYVPAESSIAFVFEEKAAIFLGDNIMKNDNIEPCIILPLEV
jgi:hypothetical protein